MFRFIQPIICDFIVLLFVRQIYSKPLLTGIEICLHNIPAELHFFITHTDP